MEIFVFFIRMLYFRYLKNTKLLIMKKISESFTILLLSVFLLFVQLNLNAQQAYAPESLSNTDYDGAAKFLSRATYPLVSGMSVRATWINNNHFWYRETTPEGYKFLTVNAKKGKMSPSFDHEKLATALSELRNEKIEPSKLPFYSISYSDDMKSVSFTVKGDYYNYNIKNNQCEAGVSEASAGRNTVKSPDGKHAAFIRDYNLWVKDLVSGKEKQLTHDGVKDFGYATDNAGWRKSKRPVLLWSPDSKKIATFQMDEHGVGEMYMISTKAGHPKLEAWRYPLPEDSVIFRIHRVVIDVVNSQVIRLKMKPDQHRSTITDDIAGRDGSFLDVEWSPDATKLAFVSVSRDHKKVVLRVADPETGMVRDVLNEETDTFFESGYNSINWKILPESGELIWFSQRSNWGHLYLYSLGTGDLKNQNHQR